MSTRGMYWSNELTRYPGAYGVRYLFVIYDFSLSEVENVGTRFLLGRTPETDHLEPF